MLFSPASRLHTRLSSLATFDRAPPPLFRQGASALSKLIFFCALALFLMVADARFKVTQPLRSVLASGIYPLQWLVMQPLHTVQWLGGYFQDLNTTQIEAKTAQAKLILQTQKSTRVDQLELENQRLRSLLSLKEAKHPGGVVAQVLYDAPDPYTRKVVIDKGSLQDVQLGSPVLDESGVLGQVTRVHMSSSEVTLVTDRDHTIPVLNTRTGERSVGYGDPTSFGGTLELRFMGTTADVQTGDLLTTSGVDGIYPPGLPVAKVEKIERRGDSQFAKIHSRPVAKVSGALHVMLLSPLTPIAAHPLANNPAQTTHKKGVKK